MTTFRKNKQNTIVMNKSYQLLQNPIFWIAALLLYITILSACKSPTAISGNQPVIKTDQELTAIARAIHEKSLVLDAHADIVTPTTAANFLSQDGQSKVALSKLEAGGVDAVVLAVAVPPGARTEEADAQARKEADAQLASVVAMVANHPNKIVLVTSAAALEQAKKMDKIALLLGFQNARSLQKNIASIDTFYQAGIRVFGLNHLGHNAFSDSSRPFFDSETSSYEPDSEHSGLSDLGKAAIQRMNELGAIIDVSQMSKAATLQTLQLSKAPIIASHSNVRAISNVSRNLSDEEIDLIGKKNGLIHVAPFRAYLLNYADPALIETIKTARRKAGVSEVYSYPFELYWEIKDPVKKYAFLKAISDIIGPADVNHLINHIDYIVKRIGINHVGIGTDFNHGSGIDGFVDAADALNVTIGLVKRGYTAEDIEKIWGSNFLRVFKEVEQRR